jgi:hypothetical protein
VSAPVQGFAFAASIASVRRVEIYELRCASDERDVPDVELCREWELVYTTLRNGPVAAAEIELAAFLARYPSDSVARYHIARTSPAKQPGETIAATGS